MFIPLGYGLCLELALVVVTLLFALSVACLLVGEGSLQLGSLVRIVVRGPGYPASRPATGRTIPPPWAGQVISGRRANFSGIRG
jgi:hypothetical protein